MSPRLAGIIRIVFWSVNALLLGAFFMAISFGMGLPKVAIWVGGLWGVWAMMSPVFITLPLLRWVAKTLYHGEISAWRRPINRVVYARGRGIVLLKDDTSILRWKSCSLTLFFAAWSIFSNLFIFLAVIIPIARWLAEIT
ncbi:MAG: hypothetical protein H6672_07475 [Anaerolineaceae bacterium]|nr:hypothetical protein [Anaerolineaceae bacterium]